MNSFFTLLNFVKRAKRWIIRINHYTMKSVYTIIALFIFTTLHSQSLKELYNKSVQSYENKDFKKYKEYNLEALKIHPSHPTFLYNLAASYALNEEYNKATNALIRIISWKSDLPYLKDNDFQLMLENSELNQMIKSNNRIFAEAKEQSSIFTTLSKNYHIEDLAMVKGKLLLTDIRNGHILKLNLKKNEVTELTKLDGSAIAITTEKKERTFWVSSVKLPQFNQYTEGNHEAVIREFDVKSGKRISEIVLSRESEVIGSMVIGKNGKLYASSSSKPRIYVIDIKNKTVKDTIAIEDAYNLQGVTLNEDATKLYVADYIKGIGIIDLSNPKERVWLRSDNYLLKGIDGLTFVNKTELIAVQNNSLPKRVIKIKHNYTQVLEVELLDNNLPYKGEPTNVISREGHFYYIANSQWPFYDKKYVPINESWQDQVIRKLTLN